MADVPQLLADSVAAHLRYRAALLNKQPVAAREALTEAFHLRKAALLFDEARTHPVWAEYDQTHPHEALMAFYGEQLA